MLDEIECSLEIDCDDGIEVLFAHLEQESVSRDACVVNENVDAAEVLIDLSDSLADLVKISYIALVCLCVYAECLYFVNCSLALIEFACIDYCDVVSALGELLGDG